MNQPQTFSILIWANPAKTDAKGLLPLYARVTVNGRRAEISLKKKVDPDKWNGKAGFLKGSSAEARQVNAYLNQIRSELFGLYNQLRTEEAALTADSLKQPLAQPTNGKRCWKSSTTTTARWNSA